MNISCHPVLRCFKPFFEPPSNGKHMFGLGPCKTRRLCEIPVVCWMKVINTRKWKYSQLGRSCRGNTGVAGTEDSACRQDRKWRDIHSGFAFPNLRSECFWHGFWSHHKWRKILAIDLVSRRLGTWFSSNRPSKQEIEEHLSSQGTDALDQFKGQMGQKHLGTKNSLRSSNKKGEDPRWFKYEIRIEMWGKL